MLKKSSNKRKKCFITEEDTSIILQRYPATTVLTLLQEVAQVAGVKIDWNKMVRKTNTGITNPREYQMLWRHLAYQDPLLDGVENGTQPLDDDSDLECELEAFPAVDAEASAEAVACVKVLVASGLSNDGHGTNRLTVEAPLTINIPQGHASCTPSVNHEFSSAMRRKNITVPVAVRKQTLPSATGPVNSDHTGPATGNGASKRKNVWSPQEDEMLVEAVREYGEGNWTAIIKGPFKMGKTAAQLSKRWAILKKKLKDPLGAGTQLSEVQLAARRAVSLALNMPMGDNLKSFKAGPNSHVASGTTTLHQSAAEFSSVGSQLRARAQQDPLPLAAECSAAVESSRSWVPSKNPHTKMTVSPDRVKEAAVAAGARIATPSDFPSLFIAQPKNAMHIKSGCNSMMKPSMPGNLNQLPSNVHFIRTGLVNKPLSTNACVPNASRHGSSQEVLANLAKPDIGAVTSNSDEVVLGLGASSQVNNDAAPNLTSKLEVKTSGMATDASATHATRVLHKNNNSEAVPSLLMPEASGDQAVSSSAVGQAQMDQSSSPSNNLKETLNDKLHSSLGAEAKEPHEKNGASVSGSGMKEVQSNSLSSKDTVMHDRCEAKESGISANTNACSDATKSITGAEKLQHMDTSDVK